MNGLQQGPRNKIMPNKAMDCRFGWYNNNGLPTLNNADTQSASYIIKKLLIILVAESDKAASSPMSANIPGPVSV
ncbi:unnamed protein product [Mucor fragilis]